MVLYSLYKLGGREGVAALGIAEQRGEVAQVSGDTLRSALMSDLGRSDVQAFLLYRLARPGV